MKKHRQIYQKLREVKHHHLVKLYKKHLKRVPDNCKYNYPYYLKKEKISTMVCLCLLHQPETNLPKGRFIWPPPCPDNAKIHPHLLDICQEIHHSTYCNAFTFRYTKKDIQEHFKEILKDKKFKEKEYPDICAIEWVLDESVLNVLSQNWGQRFFSYIKNRYTKNKVYKETSA